MENYEEERDVISFEENKSEEKEISFEESLEELENIVNRLESGDVPLDDAISEFNRAMILVKACDDKLKNAEKAIAKIVRENDDVVDYFCKRINATKRSDFIWTLAKNPKYQLVGGIIKKEMENEQHWFFNVENPFECFADAIEYINDENLRKQVLTEFENSAQLISNVQNGEVVVTSRLKACSLLLESENFKTIVKKVEKELAEKNKEEWTGNISVVGNLLIVAATTVVLKGFGVFDGNYIIVRASHGISNGYTTSFDVRRCLSGY